MKENILPFLKSNLYSDKQVGKRNIINYYPLNSNNTIELFKFNELIVTFKYYNQSQYLMFLL